MCVSLSIRVMFVCCRWAASTVMTRMNNIPSEEEPGAAVPALIPYWDLCNHSNGRVSDPTDRGDLCNHSNGRLCNHSTFQPTDQ